MTNSAADLALYAAGILALFLTPGPVWLALSARALAGGFAGVWPLALGVAIGDILWPLLAILGMSWVVSEIEGFMTVLRFVAVAVFWGMGWQLIAHADRRISTDSRLTRPGRLSGFLAGLAVILGNPKAILFYMGILPGFFDLGRLTAADIAPILLISFAIPLLGNLALGALLARLRGMLTAPAALTRANRIAGVLLIGVGCLIPFV
jgi:threonine/homoserine/homoserine lactone efflux protein